MKLIKRLLIQALSMINLVLICSLLAIVLWQVATRYLLNDPSTVSEELARIFLMWLGPLGAAYVCAFREHMAIDLLPQSLTGAKKVRLQKLITVLSAFFSLLLIKGGAGIVSNAFRLEQKTAVLELSMGYVYLAIPLGGIFMFCLLAFDFLKPTEQLEQN